MNKKGMLGAIVGTVIVLFIIVIAIDHYYLKDAILNFVRGLF